MEINSRPERLDPPLRLIRLAVEAGCLFAIDTDAHAPGQLDWQPLGCARVAETGIGVSDRIVNSWTMDELLAWRPRATRPRRSDGLSRRQVAAGRVAPSPSSRRSASSNSRTPAPA